MNRNRLRDFSFGLAFLSSLAGCSQGLNGIDINLQSNLLAVDPPCCSQDQKMIRVKALTYPRLEQVPQGTRAFMSSLVEGDQFQLNIELGDETVADHSMIYLEFKDQAALNVRNFRALIAGEGLVFDALANRIGIRLAAGDTKVGMTLEVLNDGITEGLQQTQMQWALVDADGNKSPIPFALDGESNSVDEISIGVRDQGTKDPVIVQAPKGI